MRIAVVARRAVASKLREEIRPQYEGRRRDHHGAYGRCDGSSQCLDRRIPEKQTLVEEIAAGEADRNANHTKANWQFSTANARIKLKHLYRAI